MRKNTVLAASVLAAGLAAASPAGAQAVSAPVALVVANARYAALPPLPACELSANLVSAVLSRAGFRVTRQDDLGNARLGAAIAAVGEEAAATPGSRSLIYVCSYAVSYADRLFLLPVAARMDRDSDVLTGGIVARLLMSSVAGPGSQAGLVLMDVAAPPGKGALAFGAMLRPADAAHGGLMAAGLATAGTPGAAPLASALSGAIGGGGGGLEVGALLASLSADPALRRSILAVRQPAEPSWLLGAPVAAAVPAPAATVPAATVAAAAAPAALPADASAPLAPAAPAPVASAPAASASAAPAPAAPAPAAAPAEAGGTALADPNPADRRRLQLSLSRLGYYRGRVDGVFAADTALAIRRFQRDSGAVPTGRLSVRQMDQLLH